MTSLLVTGGTGTVGSAVIRNYLKTGSFSRIVVFSRDEYKQWQMRQELHDDRMRYFLGDVRDAQRLKRACEGVDTIVHCAALKQIDSGETDPIEVAKTNVDGSMNVIDAALDNNVRRMVAISTDKAVEPTCLYGATKKVMEGLVLRANAYVGHRPTSFCVVRMGNIVGSRGSVIPLFNRLKKEGKSLPVTSVNMTRYWITEKVAVNLIASATEGSLMVYTPPRLGMRMIDLLSAYNCNHHTIGLRDGEKLHEKMDAVHSSEHPDEWVSVDEIREALCSF